jgi:hypothetical protein
LSDDFAKDLGDSFKRSTSAPLIGRITAIVAFFPSTAAEQAVVAHTFLLKEVQRWRLPINLGEDKLIGDLHISTLDDDTLWSLMAKNHYDPDFGARSLAHAVTDDIMVPLVTEFLDQEEGLGRGSRAVIAIDKYSVQIYYDGKTNESEINVHKDGETRLKSVTHKIGEPLFSTQESWELLDQESFTMCGEDAGAAAAKNFEVLCKYSAQITRRGWSRKSNTPMCLPGKCYIRCGHYGHIL